VVFWRRFEKLQRREAAVGSRRSVFRAGIRLAKTRIRRGGISMSPNKRDGGQPRQPEVPVIDDPVEPVEPKVPEMPPPVPDPPEVVGMGYGGEEHYYDAEAWSPASWQPHPAAASTDRPLEHH
jgi:hypothetical protein